MITKWIQFRVAEDSASDFRAELSKIESASRAEAGCVHYAAFQSTDTPALFTVLESWEGAEVFEAHRQSAHIAAFKERCAEMIEEKSGLSLEPLATEAAG